MSERRAGRRDVGSTRVDWRAQRLWGVIVIPDKMSQEKLHHLRAVGGEVIANCLDVGPGHTEYHYDIACWISDETGNAFYVD